MASGIPRAMAGALRSLNKDELDRFIFELRHRADQSLGTLGSLEGKTIFDITNALVSACTTNGALAVTLETLRSIGCNQEALDLEMKTKAFMDQGHPTFRRTSDGKLDLRPSQEAQGHVAFGPSLAPDSPVKEPAQVQAEAKALVLSEGGDSSNDRVVLSKCAIQFGQYKGKTFKWLLENDPNYVVKIVANHQQGPRDQSPLMANKAALIQYAKIYREICEEVKFHRDYNKAKEQSCQRGQAGKALVGFGKYRRKTLKDLYESKDESHISFVNFLRRRESSCLLGSKMEDAVKYILQRDKQRAASRRRRGQSCSGNR